MPQITPIAILPAGMLNAFLLHQDGAALLFDTGLPGSAPRIGRALSRAGLGWGDLRLIVLSHAHIDHAGGVAELRRLTKAPVMVQRAELPYLQGEPMIFRPSGPFGRLFALTGLIQRPLPRFTPDLVIEGDHDLQPHGFAARLLWTPGHTPGSQSLITADGMALAGDLAASGILLGGIALRGRPKSPPFEEDPAAVARSIDRVLAAGATRFLLGHGGPLSRAQIMPHRDRLARLDLQHG